jgi:lipid-A-disaccharide synthase
VPTAVAYKFSRLSFWLGTMLVKVPYISLPNLILNASVFPEFLQHAARPSAIAAQIAQWIPDGPPRQTVLRQLDALPGLLGGGGAAHRAADIILETAWK